MQIKSLLFFVLFFSSGLTVKATTHKIRVANFQFSPKRVNAFVGDTLLFIYKSGFHTTTSTNIPQGAAPWDSPMDVNTRKFSYVLTVAGTYDYFCLYHAAEMRGVIKVSPLSDVGVQHFSIDKSKDGNPLLLWDVKSNDKIAYLSVQRSYTGTDFVEIMSYTGFENKGKYLDTGYIKKRFAYYIIECVTRDSMHSQTFIKEFINKEPEKLILGLNPNPVTEQHLMLKFNGTKEGTMYVKILDEKGITRKYVQLYAQRGINNAHIHLDKNIFKNGTYHLYCSMGMLKESVRFIINN